MKENTLGRNKPRLVKARIHSNMCSIKGCSNTRTMKSEFSLNYRGRKDHFVGFVLSTQKQVYLYIQTLISFTISGGRDKQHGLFISEINMATLRTQDALSHERKYSLGRNKPRLVKAHTHSNMCFIKGRSNTRTMKSKFSFNYKGCKDHFVGFVFSILK